MPKKIFNSLLACLLLGAQLLTVSIQPVKALENNDGSDEIVEVTDEAIKVVFDVAGQTFPGKDITFKVMITPQIDIARAQLAWIYDGDLFSIDKDTQIVQLSADNTLTVYGTFKINQHYKFSEKDAKNFGVKITGSAYDKNYLSISKKAVSINSDFEVTPLLSDYSQQKTVISLIYTLLALIGIGVAVWLILLGIKRFQIYLNSD